MGTVPTHGMYSQKRYMRCRAATWFVGGVSLVALVSPLAFAEEAVEQPRRYIDFSAVEDAGSEAVEHPQESVAVDEKGSEPDMPEPAEASAAVSHEDVAAGQGVQEESKAEAFSRAGAAEVIEPAAEESALPDPAALRQEEAVEQAAEPAVQEALPAEVPAGPVAATDEVAVAPEVVPEAAKEEAVPEAFSGVPVAAKPAGEEEAWNDGGFIHELQKGDRVMILPVSVEQAADTYEPLSVDEAVALAMKNNYEAKAASESTDATYWEKLATYLLYGPTFELRYAAGDETSRPASFNDTTGTRKARDKHVRRDELYSLRQPIIDLAIVEDILLREIRESYAETVEREAREGIAYDTVNAYLGLIQAGMLMKMADDYHDYLMRLEERMRARVDGGGATPGDLERVLGRMANAESARLEAEGEYVNALAEFRRITHITPSRLLITDRLAPAIPPLMMDALAYAEKSNSTYVGALQKIDIARGARDKTYAELMPTLNVEAAREKTYNAGGAAKGNPVDGVYPTQDDSRLMVVAHWSISPGYTSLNGVAGNVRVREAKYRAMDTKMRVEQAVRTSYNTVHATNQRIDVAEKGLQANTNVVREFEDQQEHGRRSLFELLDAYEQLYGSQVNMVRLITARAQAAYLVHRQMGSLLPALKAASMKVHANDVEG